MTRRRGHGLLMCVVCEVAAYSEANINLSTWCAGTSLCRRSGRGGNGILSRSTCRRRLTRSAAPRRYPQITNLKSQPYCVQLSLLLLQHGVRKSCHELRDASTGAGAGAWRGCGRPAAGTAVESAAAGQPTPGLLRPLRRWVGLCGASGSCYEYSQQCTSGRPRWSCC